MNRNIKGIIKNLIYAVLSPFVSLMPKKKIILFESISDFCDSSKALYDEMLKDNVNREYKLVWLVDNVQSFKNINEENVTFIEAFPRKIKGKIIKFYYNVFSKYCFYTHVLTGIPYNRGQVRYFLTHAAIPIKNSTGKFWNYKFNTFIECTSLFASKYRCKTFGGGEDRAQILGLPRNDYLFKKSNTIQNLIGKEYNKAILWMPTFKHINNSNRNDFNSNIQKDISLLNEETLSSINEILVKQNSYLIIKFHPSQDMRYVDIYDFSNIIFLTNSQLLEKGIEIYSMLGETDALITDFSSVYVDYLLTNKPIGFELRDKKEYEKGIGFIFENPFDFMPGHKIYNKEQLAKFINDICSNNDLYLEDRKKMVELCHKYRDGNSSKRILEFLKLI